MQYNEQQLSKMSIHQLQGLLAIEVIGSKDYKLIASILKQREEQISAIAKKTLSWGMIAGISAILAALLSILSLLFSIFQNNKP
jgi:hypothetical protein